MHTQPEHMDIPVPNRKCAAQSRNAAITFLRLLPRRAGHVAIRAYQLTFSAFAGQQCRHLPTCSAYMDEAVARHGLWAGGFMGLARLCRCHPWGSHGFDPVPEQLPKGSAWFMPWRYGDWHGPRGDEPAQR